MSFITICLIFWTTATLLYYIFTRKLSTNSVITVKPLYIRIFSERLAEVIHGKFKTKSFLSEIWFSVGTVVTLIMVPMSVVLLLYALTSPFRSDTVKKQVMEAVVPGVNLPIHDVYYYFIALLISSVFHELGHAIAAVKESIKLYGFGIFIVFVVPAAFVEISTPQMMSKSAWKRLKIMCAGVWHNIALTAIAAFLLLFNSVFLSPFYNTRQGAAVAFVNQASGVAGITGLNVGDIVISIDGQCSVFDKTSWNTCLKKYLFEPQQGYCTPVNFIEEQKIFFDETLCCDKDSSRQLCFQRVLSDQKMCVTVRSLLEKFPKRCSRDDQCTLDEQCLIPYSNDSFQLIQIERKQSDSVLFWGHAEELISALILIDYIPKYTFLPLMMIYRFETLLRYICSFSMALAVLNSIPCIWLDGKWISDTMVTLFLEQKSHSLRSFISNSLTIFGTTIVTMCVVLGIYNAIKSYI